MTNREILKTPKEQLGSLDRQRQFVLRVELTPVKCPACLKPVDALTAAGIDIDAYQFGVEKQAYRCPHCQAELEQGVPFIAVGPSWHWELKHSWLRDQMRKARFYDELLKKENQIDEADDD